MCNSFCECSFLCVLPSSPIPNARRLHFSSRKKVKEVNAWGGSVLQPLGSNFHVSNRRVTPCSLLSSGISAYVSELHHLHGIRKTLAYERNGGRGCFTSVRKIAKWKKKKCCIILSYMYDMDHSRCGSAICWMGPILSFWNCSFSVRAFSWSCLCIWLSSTSVLLIYLRNTYCQQIKRGMLMGAVCWASSASYQSLS